MKSNAFWKSLNARKVSCLKYFRILHKLWIVKIGSRQLLSGLKPVCSLHKLFVDSRYFDIRVNMAAVYSLLVTDRRMISIDGLLID